MEYGKNWGAVDPAKLQSFGELGSREQNAVRATLSGLQRWSDSGVEPKPMRVRGGIQPPFNLRAYAGVLHELRIGINSLAQYPDGSVTFQPTPYGQETMGRGQGNGETDRLRREFEDSLNRLLKDFRDLFGRSPF